MEDCLKRFLKWAVKKIDPKYTITTGMGYIYPHGYRTGLDRTRFVIAKKIGEFVWRTA